MKVSLGSIKSFSETQKIAEKRIYEIINAKTCSFLELIDYEWLLIVNFSGMSTPRRQPISYLQGN
jgi:hypothetical protein